MVQLLRRTLLARKEIRALRWAWWIHTEVLGRKVGGKLWAVVH